IMINHYGRLMTGAVITAALALLADFMIGQLETWLTPRGLKVSV
ncbi:MAG TPA: choline ABC transporter permease, partial [Firmicutes bacterium]|nr:choline ABC transporter permease [Bacillota bacterium]